MIDGSISWEMLRYLEPEERWIIEETSTGFMARLVAMKNNREKWASPSIPRVCLVSWTEDDEAEAMKWLRGEAEQDAREDHADRGRGLDVRVGQPRVERNHRHLDREGQRESREQVALRDERQRGRGFGLLGDGLAQALRPKS